MATPSFQNSSSPAEEEAAGAQQLIFLHRQAAGEKTVTVVEEEKALEEEEKEVGEALEFLLEIKRKEGDLDREELEERLNVWWSKRD